jgi:cysteine desulfurase
MVAAWDHVGNPGSPHAAGARAAAVVSGARRAVADLIGAAPSEVVFTSGATEANNIAIQGVARAAARRDDPRRRILVSSIEHKSVLESARGLAAEGFEVVEIPATRLGVVDLDALGALLLTPTLLVSIMLANNETGIIQPVEEAARLAHDAGALIHTDGAQAVGKEPVDVLDLDIDYLSLSAHKMYGPMGVGALFVSASAPKPAALQRGGGQEQGIRSGTEPAPLLAGFGAAANLARQRLAEDQAHGLALTDRLLTDLRRRQIRCVKLVEGAPTLSGALSLRLDRISADDIVQKLAHTVALSTGSACTNGQILQSHVLQAMGLAQDESTSVIRLYCGRYNTEAEIDAAAAMIAHAVGELALATGDVRQ